MGRPWWHDSYWEKKEKRRSGFQLPRWKSWAWLALAGLSLILAMADTGFQFALLAWLIGFVGYFCRILSLAIFLRVLLSWFRVSYYNRFVIILNDLTEPIILPIRRVLPSFGGFDFSPVVAIMVLYFIPLLFRWLVLLFV
jgi:YggT family protein